ncbi:MAG: hypothetical protein A3B37_02055 [Candidatus Sungbacteria bacterium RIFCSPLOWO2_01_FULL_59_16]|uniref:DUF1573 domain-containing protein n=1 Tax=Candidatus Sungbacteria bacterium RIFCSPLOWO2_01_FULL_59_16 TaxID=1802280 RepID=A0A1G2LD44_9BACT|nr:MAG: hypothetical protein A3B37_02055 [Candidatus Sungbacteria bacterium RIFCSPLOWO2_01_FULL_59_16]
MNRTTIIGIAAAVFLFGGIVWFARPSPPGGNTASPIPGGGGSLTADAASFDFGRISMAAGNVSHVFTIRNTGAEPVVIGKVYTSCMCTTAALTKGGKRFGPYGMPGHGLTSGINESVNPNEEATVEVIFDPAAHGPAGVGRIQRAVIIEQSAGQPLELGVTALVTP